MIFDFHYADIDVENGSEWFRKTDWKTKELKELIFESQNAVQKSGWGANFLENHDQPRSLTKYIKDEAYQNEIGAKTLGTLFFFLRGTPYIYQGQEIGMKNFKRDTISDFNDVSSLDNYSRAMLEGFTAEESLAFVNQRSRDNGRTPFQWDATKNAGFNEGAEPWLKLVGDHEEVNAADQVNDPESVFSFYKKMIQLRNHSSHKDTLIYGAFRPLETPDEVIGYERVGDAIIQIFVNMSNQETAVEKVSGEILLNNYENIEQSRTQSILKPYQTIVIRKDEEHV